MIQIFLFHHQLKKSKTQPSISDNISLCCAIRSRFGIVSTLLRVGDSPGVVKAGDTLALNK